MGITPRQRVPTALSGGKPDRIPVMPVCDIAYVAAGVGRDIREFITASAQERTELIENNSLRHEGDGFFVHIGTNANWVKRHLITREAAHRRITNRITGDEYWLLPDGLTARPHGRSWSCNSRFPGEDAGAR